MDREKGKIQDCLQNEPAFCTVACPFCFDVRDFIEKMQRGSFNAAYRLYLNTVGFPGIVSALCDEPCKNVCPRREKDSAISLRLLEKAALDYARNTDPNNYNVPLKNKKVAIIGAGISGLACALRLAAKKYDVTVFEKSNRIGGHLWDLLPPEMFLKEIDHQFKYEKYTVNLNTEITTLDGLNFDAIYIATGMGGNNFGLTDRSEGVYASIIPGVFLGGTLVGRNTMQAIADGLQVPGAIEWYIKTGRMNQPHETSSTKLELDPSTITYSELIQPNNGIAYTRDEAVLEAKRCLKCSCDACVRYCDLMHFFKKYPKRIAEEVELTIHPGTLDGNGTLATRFISTCNQCGLCKEVCPIGIDTGEFLLINHRIMREKGAMPWAFHDFWLRDMAFSNGPDTQLSHLPNGYSKSQYVFFPGCQLGASDPKYVIESYQWLLAHKPDTAIMLNCCGAPAEWAGDEIIHNEVIGKLRDQWGTLGKPVVVFACPTCKQMFNRYLPEIEGIFLYDLILKWGDTSTKESNGEIVSIFDPCSSREEPELQQAIRDLVKQAGLVHEPLPMEGRLAACCSWGGQVAIANPRYTREVISARITQNENPYVTYCINCRDIFASSQKPAYHILDILFGLYDSNRAAPTFTERRRNRVKLKNDMLREYWKDEFQMDQDERKIILYISDHLKQKLNSDHILESEIETVIEHCESKGKKIVSPETGHFFGHLQIGNMTYWAEYLLADNGFELINAYCHRMSIDEG
ncbi:MAG: FAD-dependent oxidoreductase [Anaerolineales bacterium]|nr:FAD-dependent oxidoreductase [Anaerolineales bacterium]